MCVYSFCMDPTRFLYTRREVGNLVGLDDVTLNYWSREELLIPIEGGGGRGSHRRFDFIQVNIAAILGQLRRFGLNISIMRSLSGLLQDAAKLGSGCELHPGNLSYAANLATKLNEFRNGRPVMVPEHGHNEERPSNLHGKAHSDWLLAEKPAETEQEIIDRVLGRIIDYDSIQKVVAIAKTMGPGRETEAQIYADLVYDLVAPGYSDAYSWLLGFGPDETWRIEFGFEGANFFGGSNSQSSEEFGAGIFLPVSGIIRKVWRLKTSQEYMRERRAERLQMKLADVGITAKVIPNDGEDDSFKIDAPDVEWKRVEAVLSKEGCIAADLKRDTAGC